MNQSSPSLRAHVPRSTKDHNFRALTESASTTGTGKQQPIRHTYPVRIFTFYDREKNTHTASLKTEYPCTQTTITRNTIEEQLTVNDQTTTRLIITFSEIATTSTKSVRGRNWCFTLPQNTAVDYLWQNMLQEKFATGVIAGYEYALEQSAAGYCHYHGFIKVTDSHRRSLFTPIFNSQAWLCPLRQFENSEYYWRTYYRKNFNNPHIDMSSPEAKAHYETSAITKNSPGPIAKSSHQTKGTLKALSRIAVTRQKGLSRTLKKERQHQSTPTSTQLTSPLNELSLEQQTTIDAPNMECLTPNQTPLVLT